MSTERGRNVLVHEYAALDMARVVEALDGFEPVEEFLEIARTVVEGDAITALPAYNSTAARRGT